MVTRGHSWSLVATRGHSWATRGRTILIKRLKRFVTYKHTKYVTILLVQKFQVSSIVYKDELCTDGMAAILRHLTSVLNLSMRTKTEIPRFVILVPRAYDLFGQRWDRLVSTITGCREFHDIR